MKQLRSYIAGTWHDGREPGTLLVNPATEAPVAQVRAIENVREAVVAARLQGGEQARALPLPERARILGQLAKRLHAHRDELLDLATTTGGNTRSDAKFDVDGAIAVLSTYSEIGAQLGEGPTIAADPEAVEILRGSKLRAQDVLVPRRGLAIQINAFNFPAWGLVGKFAVAFLAGMPVLTKPATSTAALAERIVEIIVESALVPSHALSLMLGPAQDLLDHVCPQDVIAFTGSAHTGQLIRTHARVIDTGARVNIEADSLNAAVVAPDVQPGTEMFDALIRDLRTEMVQKAGQKCTATRRVIVPREQLQAIREALVERLRDTAAATGDPALPEVKMGPLATAGQLKDARAGIERLASDARIVFGDPNRTSFVGVKDGQGYFLEPILLEADEATAARPDATFHALEVFGPVATLLPYDGTVAAAGRIVEAGSGSLVSTLYTSDREFVRQSLTEIAPYVGRLVLTDEKHAASCLPPGGVFPVVQHGGPGRAGGGAELGRMTGLSLYMQRTTLQAGAASLARLLGKS